MDKSTKPLDDIYVTPIIDTLPIGSPKVASLGSQKRHLESPIEKEESPSAKVESPAAKMESPAAKVESPITNVESPVPKVKSPGAKVESPAAKGESLLARVESPIAKGESPIARVESPIAKGESPIARVESPIAKEESPLEKAESISDQENIAASEFLSHEQGVGPRKDNTEYTKGAMVIGTAKVDIISQSPGPKVTTGSPKSKQSRKSKMPKRSAVYTDGKIQGYVVKKSTGAKTVLTEMDKALEGVESMDTNNNSEKLIDEGQKVSLGDVQPEIKIEEDLPQVPNTEISQGPHEESGNPSDAKKSHDVTPGTSQDVTTRRSHDITPRRSHDITPRRSPDVKSRSHDDKEMTSPSPVIKDDNQVPEDQKESLRLPLRPIFLDEIDNSITTTEQIDTSVRHIDTSLRDINTSQKCKSSTLPQHSQDSHPYSIGQNVINIVPENEPILIKEEVDERTGASLEKLVSTTERTGDTESMEQSERPGYPSEQSERPGYQLPYEDAYLEQVTSVSQQVRTLYFPFQRGQRL